MYPPTPENVNRGKTNVQALLSSKHIGTTISCGRAVKMRPSCDKAVNVEKCQTATDKTSKNKTHPPTYVKLTFLVAI